MKLKIAFLNIVIYLATCTMLAHTKNSIPKIYIYNQSKSCDTIATALERFNIPFELTDSMSDPDNLYIIFNVFTIEESKLPKNYIAYQTEDLNTLVLHAENLKKLSNAIAIWDISYENIYKYNTKIHNYLYFPDNYEYTDMVILSCSLPFDALPVYKELLTYSNKNNSDFSSHLPTLFCYAVTQNPKIIVEAGVSLGVSTIALSKASEFCQAHLFGIDTDPKCAQIYKNLKNADFVWMSDLQFGGYYLKSQYKEMLIDLVFIDTSHMYKHTCDEINLFESLLSKNGMMIFHDSNVTPLNNGKAYLRLNNTIGSTDFCNPRGVTQAIKEFLSLSFDENKYLNTLCQKNGITWHVTHYPFCNGLTILQKK